MKERVDAANRILYANDSVKVVLKDLWEENQTIVNEYQLLTENITSMQQTERAAVKKLVTMQERDRIYREALSNIMIHLIAAHDKDMIKNNVIKCKEIIEQALSVTQQEVNNV